jgi:hypothetical protein
MTKTTGTHDQHEADEDPAHAVHAALEAGLRALSDDGLRQRSEIGAGAGRDHDGGRGAAHHVCAEKADVGAIEEAAAVFDPAARRFLDHRAQRVVFLDRQSLPGQRGLADEKVAG